LPRSKVLFSLSQNSPAQRIVPHTWSGKYYELVKACSDLDTQALGAVSRADFERALSSPTLRLQPHEVFI